MLFRVSASKDNFVTNKMVGGRRVTGSNGGASEIMQLYKLSTPPHSGTQAHALIAFNTTQALANFSASYSTGSAQWWLILRDVATSNPNIGSFDVDIMQVERYWDEGKGQDLDYWTDKGVSNWLSATNSSAWTNAGARPSGTLSSSFHFSTGHEDMEVEVTNLISSSSLGFWIGLSSQQEHDNNDYYLKAFRSRQTHFPQYAPALELRWNDATGSYDSAFVDIIDSTSLLMGNIYNLRTVYDRSENPVLKTYFKPYNWNLALVETGSSDVSGTILTNAYYRVVDDNTEEIIIPFATGALKYTKLSYSDQGNYFQFPMQNLTPGIIYRFDVGYYDLSGSWNIVNGDFKFRVT